MKKIMMTTAFAVALFASSQMTAQKTDKDEQVETIEVQEVAPMQQKFKEIATEKLSPAVKSMITKNFKDAKVTKAYVNADKEYKLELTDADGKKQTVFANAKGEMLKK